MGGGWSSGGIRPISGAFESEVETSEDDVVFVLDGVAFSSLVSVMVQNKFFYFHFHFTFLFSILFVSIFLYHFFCSTLISCVLFSVTHLTQTHKLSGKSFFYIFTVSWSFFSQTRVFPKSLFLLQLDEARVLRARMRKRMSVG